MNIAVYCGSTLGNDKIFREVAVKLGMWIGKNKHTLVYGGGKSGLMGIVAETVLQEGGEVIGIIPEFLCDKELKNIDVTELQIVQNMSERKKRMADLSQAYIALPGGSGTLEEIAEVISWSKLGQNPHPCILMNIKNFYEPLKDLFKLMVDKKFLEQEEFDQILFSDNIDEIENFIKNYKPLKHPIYYVNRK